MLNPWKIAKTSPHVPVFVFPLAAMGQGVAEMDVFTARFRQHAGSMGRELHC